MKIKIAPCRAHGTLSATPSKSEAHRAIICAALAKGKSVISNIVFSDDISATAECIGKAGCVTECTDGKITVTGGEAWESEQAFCCRESGSTLRFLLPVCLVKCGKAVFTGSERLFERPLGVYEEIFGKQGIIFEKSTDTLAVSGKLKSGEFTVNGNVSSQFISGLMLALPVLDGDSVIKIKPPFESRAYVLLTAEIMARFGVSVYFENEYTVRIPGGQKYCPCSVSVGGDWSNAAYLMAFEGVEVFGTDENSVQGDKVCREYFHSLSNGFCTLDMKECIDLAPIMFAYAATHDGGHFTGTHRLKIKESDRIACMKTEAAKLGITIIEEDNAVTVKKGVLHAPKEELYGHNDHRIVMALTYLLTFTGGVLCGAQAVKKSFPDYFEVIKKAGISVECEQEQAL